MYMFLQCPHVNVYCKLYTEVEVVMAFINTEGMQSPRLFIAISTETEVLIPYSKTFSKSLKVAQS